MLGYACNVNTFILKSLLNCIVTLFTAISQGGVTKLLQSFIVPTAYIPLAQPLCCLEKNWFHLDSDRFIRLSSLFLAHHRLLIFGRRFLRLHFAFHRWYSSLSSEEGRLGASSGSGDDIRPRGGGVVFWRGGGCPFGRGSIFPLSVEHIALSKLSSPWRSDGGSSISSGGELHGRALLSVAASEKFHRL